jgi:glycosyltransferase involved in cell wall biosynthesis
MDRHEHGRHMCWGARRGRGNTRDPRVTVGMAVYNGADFVAEAIESILDQIFRYVELVIADNASTDSTPDICRSFAVADDRAR